MVIRQPSHSVGFQPMQLPDFNISGAQLTINSQIKATAFRKYLDVD